jgi:hypothetical protein
VLYLHSSLTAPRAINQPHTLWDWKEEALWVWGKGKRKMYAPFKSMIIS